MTLKRLLLSRGMVLAIVVSLTAMMVLASLVPQSFMTPAARLEEWRVEHPALAGVVAALGLHRVYTHPVFAALLVVALTGLGYSSVDQFRAALRKLRPRGAPAGGAVVELPVAIETVAGVLRSRGYLRVRGDGAERLLVRHPWGYWGNFLFHGGMATVVAASTLIGVTQQRGALHLVEGETFRPGGPWFAEENGVAAPRLVLPFSVRLDHLQYGFWPTYGLRSATSTLSLLRPGVGTTTVKVGINDLQQVQGLRIYQGAELGHAFRLEVRAGDRSQTLVLLIQHPPTPDAPGTNEFRDVLPGGEVLRARYWVDADRRSFEDFNPLLVLRVDAHGGSLGEARLRPGTTGDAGPYRFRLEKMSLWTRLFFVRVTGIAGVFAGFLVIALGGILHYFTPPREAVLLETGAGATRMVWRAARFASFYTDEVEDICAAVTPGGTRG